MARQQDILSRAIRDFVRIIERGDGNDMQVCCGNNLSVAIQRSDATGDYDQIIMYSYNAPIARACLSDLDENGDVKVELNVYYYNYSMTTSKHLTFFLSALYYALPMSRGIFDRRANRPGLRKRANEAIELSGRPARITWFTL